MDTPALRVSPQAREVLQGMIGRIHEFDAVASVCWFTGGTDSDGGVTGPHWSVGFYDPRRIEGATIVEIEGVRFFFGQEHENHRLHGARLDYLGGQFIVAESAI